MTAIFFTKGAEAGHHFWRMHQRTTRCKAVSMTIVHTTAKPSAHIICEEMSKSISVAACVAAACWEELVRWKNIM